MLIWNFSKFPDLREIVEELHGEEGWNLHYLALLEVRGNTAKKPKRTPVDELGDVRIEKNFRPSEI